MRKRQRETDTVSESDRQRERERETQKDIQRKRVGGRQTVKDTKIKWTHTDFFRLTLKILKNKNVVTVSIYFLFRNEKIAIFFHFKL